MAYKIFIDGKEGTTGLKIFERFANRNDIELITIDEDKRKDSAERAKMINESDFTFLCLPDAAAIESAALCTNPKTVIIDASTAHRTNDFWAYGFPELDKCFREKIEKSNRIAVPGCYASGTIAILYPLVKSQIMPKDYPVCVHAVSGYSGAGKKAIAQYEDSSRNPELSSPRLYALTQNHKHLPEIKKISGLDFEPIFNPYICDYVQGMSVTVGLHSRLLSKKVTAKDVVTFFKELLKECSDDEITCLLQVYGAKSFREGRSEVEIQTVGAGAVNQAIKAISIARGFVAPLGMNLICTPAFYDVVIDGKEKTAIKLLVESK